MDADVDVDVAAHMDVDMVTDMDVFLTEYNKGSPYRASFINRLYTNKESTKQERKQKKEETTAPKALKRKELANQMDRTKKRKILLFRHSGGLQSGHVEESYLPSYVGGTVSIEDEAIPLLPNLPSSNYKSFHEEDRA
jgi:hypothetical protein